MANKEEKFHVTVDFILPLEDKTVISGETNADYFKGKVAGLTVTTLRPFPYRPLPIMLLVKDGDVSSIKIGDALYED